MTRPIIILVEPQLAENIGMVARAMANFGLSELRLVSPRNGWPKKGAHSAASGAVHVLEAARLYDTAREAIADLNYVFATTARERGQMKRVFAPRRPCGRRKGGSGRGRGSASCSGGSGRGSRTTRCRLRIPS
jgi:tRNA/rRNA methyltransferase